MVGLAMGHWGLIGPGLPPTIRCECRWRSPTWGMQRPRRSSSSIFTSATARRPGRSASSKASSESAWMPAKLVQCDSPWGRRSCGIGTPPYETGCRTRRCSTSGSAAAQLPTSARRSRLPADGRRCSSTDAGLGRNCMQRSSRRRVVINTDAKNEADDQFAIVHALLSPSLEVRGLIAAHFGTSRSNRSMKESREEIDLLLDLLGVEHHVTVANGAPVAIANEQTPMDSAGAQLIIAESNLATAQEPLFVAFLGPLTDMASAILLDPGIVHRDLVVIWIGGVGSGGVETYPGWNSTSATTSPPPMSSMTPAAPCGRCLATSIRRCPSATPSSRRRSAGQASSRTT